MPARILVHHHARHRAPRPLAAMRTPPRRQLDQPAALQKQLRPRVAQLKPGRPRQVLVEMLGRETPEPVKIQRLDLRRNRVRHAVGRSRPNPAVAQTILTLLAIPRRPPAERPFPRPQATRPPPAASARRTDDGRKCSQTACPVCPVATPTGASGPPPGKPIITGQIECYLNRTHRVLPTRNLTPVAPPPPPMICAPHASPVGDSLAVELPTLTRKALVRIQVPQPIV